MNPLPMQIKLIFLAVALFMAFSFGWATNGWRHERQIADLKAEHALEHALEREKAADELVKQKDGYDEVSRFLVKRLQEVKGKDRVVYRTIKEKVYESTSGAVCLGADAVSVFNASLTGDLPEPQPGPAGAPAGASEAGATDTEVLSAAVANNEQYKACRDQLNALIDWHEIARDCQKKDGDIEACIKAELEKRS